MSKDAYVLVCMNCRTYGGGFFDWPTLWLSERHRGLVFHQPRQNMTHLKPHSDNLGQPSHSSTIWLVTNLSKALSNSIVVHCLVGLPKSRPRRRPRWIWMNAEWENCPDDVDDDRNRKGCRVDPQIAENEYVCSLVTRNVTVSRSGQSLVVRKFIPDWGDMPVKLRCECR